MVEKQLFFNISIRPRALFEKYSLSSATLDGKTFDKKYNPKRVLAGFEKFQNLFFLRFLLPIFSAIKSSAFPIRPGSLLHPILHLKRIFLYRMFFNTSRQGLSNGMKNLWLSRKTWNTIIVTFVIQNHCTFLKPI